MTVPTDFQPPSKTTRSPGKFLQRRWFRVIFLTCLLGVCLVAGLVVGGLFFIETRPAQAFIQKQVNKMIPGSLSWEQFSLDLRAGRVQISGVHLKGISGKELAGIPLVTAKLDWSGVTRQKIEL